MQPSRTSFVKKLVTGIQWKQDLDRSLIMYGREGMVVEALQSLSMSGSA